MTAISRNVAIVIGREGKDAWVLDSIKMMGLVKGKYMLQS